MPGDFDASILVGYFDGLCKPDNPGGYACGGIYIPEQPALPGKPAVTESHCYRHGEGATNNVAEYLAAIDAVYAMQRTGWFDGAAYLYSDSKLLVEQFYGRFACKSDLLEPLLESLHDVACLMPRLEFRFVRREHNRVADQLSRLAYRRALGEV